MRDPARIDRICDLLRQAWHRSPDLRLGQLVNNLIGRHDEPFAPSLVHVEDSVTELRLIADMPLPDVLASIEQRIRAFEAEHMMSSGMMRTMVESGAIAPTLEVDAWLLALRVRDELLITGGDR